MINTGTDHTMQLLQRRVLLGRFHPPPLCVSVIKQIKINWTEKYDYQSIINLQLFQ